MLIKPAPQFGSKLENASDGNSRGPVISQQLEELLASSPFRNSKRCQSLLAYVVRETLADRADRLKERTIGVDVFGREPSYDTNHDAVVRNAAAEVRKRLAQFYMEHEQLIRIELPLGSYVPIFLEPRADKAALAESNGNAPQPELGKRPLVPDLPDKPSVPANLLSRNWLKPLLAALIIGAGMASWFAWHSARPLPEKAIDRFWAPALAEREAVQICVGQPLGLSTFAGNSLERTGQNSGGTLPSDEMEKIGARYLYVGDALALLKLGQLLQAHGKAYRQRIGARQTNYSDLRGFPTVLIGAFNNDWTRRLTDDLRYYFSEDTRARTKAVMDRQHRDQQRWTLPDALTREQLTEDYALVTRLRDPATERTVISMGGITDFGTLAAAEFLTDADYMRKAFEHAPANWEKENIQVVLKTHIVANAPGPPTVEATYFWN